MRIRLVPTLVLLLIVSLASACGGEEQPAGPAPAPDQLAGGPNFSGAASGESLAALGTVRPALTLQLGFGVGGPVLAVHVQVGSPVKKGDLLAELDTAALELDLQDAQAGVAICQAQLDRLVRGRLPELVERAEDEHAQQVAQAEVALQVAQERLQQAREAAAVSQEEARLSLSIAANTLRDAQDAYSLAYWENEKLRQQEIDLSQQQKDAEASAKRRVENAEAAMAQARLAYEHAGSATEGTALKAEVKLAQAALDGLQVWTNPYRDPAAPEEIAQARARLQQAEVVVARLQLQLQRVQVVAPFDGVIAAVYLEEGEWAVAGSAVLEVVDTSRWCVETRDVGELEIGRVQVGQEAAVQVNAFRGVEIKGQVVTVSPVAVVQQGDTTYTLLIELEATALNLQPGMTAQVTILTD